MIEQSNIGLDSRDKANPYLENGMLPIITAPMNSVLDEVNKDVFLENKINLCLPRGVSYIGETKDMEEEKTFVSLSLQDFYDCYLDVETPLFGKQCVCIDTANGNMPKLHTIIRAAKQKHGDNLIIMAGNVSSTKAFIELAITGVDYIRVGVGGGAGCTTTVHTGVGQECLKELIYSCYSEKLFQTPSKFHSSRLFTSEEISNLNNVKIVADGISSYIKSNDLHENGYAAINNLLNAGADLVMIGSIFARAIDSAAKKYSDKRNVVSAVYRGMSTLEEQTKYKKGNLRHSEGKTLDLICEYNIKEWVYGSKTLPNKYPGFVNCLKSAMSYTGAKTLKEF